MKWLAALGLALAPSAALAQPEAWQPPDPAARAAFENGAWRALETRCPAVTSSRPLRQRLIDVAAEEWARFGFPVIDNRASGLRRLVRPKGEGVVPDALNPPAGPGVKQALRLGLMEDDAPVRGAIAGYWTAVPGQRALEVQSQLQQAHRATGWAMAWSAAFISYVHCAAGAGDLADFARSDSHFDYVDQAIDTLDGAGPGGLYKARDIAAGLPGPGDLLCADRHPDPAQHYQSLAERVAHKGQPRNMHCDLVVKVSRRGGYVAVIGGNVVQAASMTLVGIRPPRGGAPARVNTSREDGGTGRPWFAVLELQGQPESASLGEAPAIRRLAIPASTARR